MDKLIITTPQDVKEIVLCALKEHDSKKSEAKSEKTTIKEKEGLITRQELMDYLKCSSTKVYLMMKKNKIPYYLSGRLVYFKLNEVIEAMKINDPTTKRRGHV